MLFEFERSFLQLMMEIGFLAAGYGYFQEADVIFEGLKELCQESSSPSIGLAFSKMCRNEFDDAINILENEAKKSPDNKDLIEAYLALALRLAGQSKRAKTIAQNLVEKGNQEAAINMAKAILEEV